MKLVNDPVRRNMFNIYKFNRNESEKYSKLKEPS